MMGNDQKSAWYHYLGVRTINFGDLGCPGRYSGVLERDFDVESQDPKVEYGAEFVFCFFFKSHKTSRNPSK